MTAPGLDAARAGDWSTCLDELLAAWRHHRTAELAALIERVGKRANPTNLEHSPAAIRRRIASLTPADISPLVSAIMRAPAITPAVIALATELAAHAEPDPRIADMLDDLYEHDEIDPRLVEQIARHDDPRTRDRLLAAADHWAKQRQHPRRADIDHLVQTTRRIPAFEVSLTADFSPYDELLAPDRTLARLLDAVYDDPANDHARFVYADALQDSADPRGELITLQLTNPGTQRERSLLKKHARAWLGAVANDLRTSGLVYRRGFPVAGRLGLIDQLPRSHADRAWHTFEELDLVGASGPELVQWLATLPALRRVRQLNALDLVHLAHTNVAWTHVGLMHTDVGVARHLSRFSQLEELDLSSDDHAAIQFAFQAPVKRDVVLKLRARTFGGLGIPGIPHDRRLDLVADYEFPPVAKHPTIQIFPTANAQVFHATIVCRGRAKLAYALALLPHLHMVKSATLIATRPPPEHELAQLQMIVPTTVEIRPASTDHPAP